MSNLIWKFPIFRKKNIDEFIKKIRLIEKHDKEFLILFTKLNDDYNPNFIISYYSFYRGYFKDILYDFCSLRRASREDFLQIHKLAKIKKYWITIPDNLVEYNNSDYYSKSLFCERFI